MSTSAPSPTASESRLVKVLDAYLAALQLGDSIDKSTLLAANPDIAEDLEACLASLDFIRVAADGASEGARGEGLFEPETRVGRLGDFRILREAGRGGMGVVYEAEQISLRRRVALKVLPFAAALDPRQLQRFRVEAQAAGQMHHTNIVPVYSVGVERGVHYYAMHFIDGRTLAEVLDELRLLAGRVDSLEPTHPTSPGSPLSPGTTTRDRSFFEAVARLGVQAAESLEYAHSLGIVHRDIKPANLMVDDRGHLWVTDFGLAQLKAEPGPTMTGDLLGTLRYMSPEQALGRRGVVDHRADVYSLGVTLYELLTLRPALDGSDRQELLRQIAFEEPPAPKKITPALPRELETIVLKAIAKEPEGRYDTAQELADDLRRFLEHRPIKARRPTLIERASKWTRRHAMAVSAAAVVLLIGSVGLTIGLVQLRTKQAEIVRQHDRARKAVDEMYTEVAEQWLSQQPKLEPLQRDFLLKALAFYQEFATEQTADPQAKSQASAAEVRAGDIHQKLGDFDRSEQAYLRGLKLNAELVAGFPRDPEYRRVLADTYRTLGSHRQVAGRSQEAISDFQQSMKFTEQLITEFPLDSQYRYEQVRVLLNFGSSYTSIGRVAEAEAADRRAIDYGEKLLAEFPDTHQFRSVLASVHNNLGYLLRKSNKHKEAEASLRRSVELNQAISRKFPKNPEYRHALAASYTNLDGILDDTGRQQEAEAACLRAMEAYESLADEYPKIPDYRRDLAVSYFNLGNIRSKLGRLDEAEADYRRALQIRQSLVAEFPNVLAHRRYLCDSLDSLGNLHYRIGKLSEAESIHRQALEQIQELVSKSPEIPENLSLLGACEHNLGGVLTDQGHRREASVLFEQAIVHQEAALQVNPDQPTYRLFLRNHFQALASVSKSLCDHVRAARATEESLRVSPSPGQDLFVTVKILVECQKLAVADPQLSVPDREAKGRGYVDRASALLKNAARSNDDPRTLSNIAWILSTSPTPQLRDPVLAVETGRQATERAPNHAGGWNSLGLAQYRAGAWDQSIESASRSIELSSGGSPVDWFVLAMAHWQKGDKDQAGSSYAKALARMKQVNSKNEDIFRIRDEAGHLIREGELDAMMPNGTAVFTP